MALPITGIGQSNFAVAESSFDSGVAFAATDALSPVGNGLEFEPTQEWLENEEHTGSASPQKSIEGVRGGSWSGEFHFKPVNSSTQPDIGPLLLASGFTYGSSAYTLNSSDAGSVQLGRMEGVHQEIVNGAFSSEVSFSVEGNAIPKINFSGEFASYGHCSGTITAASGSGTSYVLDSGDAWKIRPGARLTIDGNTNSSAGYLVTALASDGITLTVGSTGPTLSGGETIIPYIPSTTTAGTALSAIDCSLTIGGVSVGFINYSLTMETGISGLNREATTNRFNRVVRGKRKITGSISFYLLDASAAYLTNFEGTTRAINCRVGSNTSGARVTLACPAARLMNVKKVDANIGEAATFEADFEAFQSSTANDEFSITLD